MSARPAALGQRRMMLAVVGIGALFVLFFPMRQLVQQRSDIASLEQRLAALRTENGRLSKDVDRLSDPKELEVLARERLGLVRPGERAYFVEPVKPKQAPAEKAAHASLLDRAWTWLSSILRGRD
jgi:cell division protein FtsB